MSAYSQNYYWEDPLNIETGESFYPQQISSEQGYILTAWQEYDKNNPSMVTILGSYSESGSTWSEPVPLIESFSYTGEDRVSLFSLSTDRNGTPILALAASEKRIDIYRLSDLQSPMIRISRIESESSSVVPRVFRKADKGLILFLTGKVILPNETEVLSIYFSESEEGEVWTTPEHFIQSNDLKQNFLPHYAFDDLTEYVVFQSLYTDQRNTYQLFLKSKDRNESTWSSEVQLTTFSEFRSGENNDFFLFDNQRPHIYAEDGRIHLVWERRLGREMPQVYYGVFDRNASVLEEIEQISRGTYFTAYPRIIRDKGESLILWFDNRNGNQIIMAQKKGIFWQEKRISLMTGDSTYGRWIKHKDDLFILWENQLNENRNISILTPDRSALPPLIKTVNFQDKGRQSNDSAVISWRRPVDSSGILGFSYLWDKNPESQPEKDPDLLDLRERTEAFRALDDGDWYFHIALVDYAGNWSETLHLRITRDTIPPEPVRFFKPLTDALGYLISNTFTLTWSSSDEHPGGYSYQFYFLGEDVDLMDPSLLDLPSPPGTVQTLSPAVQYNNRDNGFWALSVSAFDDVGNRSEPSILLFRTNKYIPVTYISDVQTKRDELERVVLTIIGRGFSERGRIRRIVLDKNGQPPWDYEYTLIQNEYVVSSDRIINGPLVEVFEEGSYLVGVEHPIRGFAFAKGRLQLDSTGTVRFGDFSFDYKTFWTPVDLARHIFNLNSVAFSLLIFFLILICFLSSWQIFRLVAESKHLEDDIKSVIEGTPFRSELIKERMKVMKRRGMGLRLKFTLALLTLILAVILLISIFLGNYMINTQKKNLSEGLYAKSSLLLETLATSARTYLPTQNRLELGLLPGTIRAMDEALNTTITGQGTNDPENFNYIWSSNNPEIDSLQKFPSTVAVDDLSLPEGWSLSQAEGFDQKYKKNENYDFTDYTEKDRPLILEALDESGLINRYEAGVSRIDDQLSPKIKMLEIEINQKAVELIGDQSTQLDQLSEDAVRLALRGDTASLEELRIIQDTISRIETEINDKLATVSNIIQTNPDYSIDTLSEKQLVYTFYKPIVYRNKGRESYFRGIIRLDVSIQRILEDIIGIQNDILRITMIISLIALAGGLAGALLLAQTMLNPIRKLVEGVALVRDTQDKSKLKNYSIETGTRDELSELANTFNQMTEGLVAAAVANKSLVLGKEIQKKFLPLDPVPGADRKYTTGEELNDKIHFFGYYEGAKGVSGDYFDYRRLDEKHYATIKCDISGKDIPASLIMVEVATLFKDYFSKLDIKRDGIHLEKLVMNINDLIAEIDFQGKFAALIVTIINIETGKCWICHAGDKIFYYYDGTEQRVVKKEMETSPAAGMFTSDVIGDDAFKQITHQLKKNDILFLFTDGIEEAKRTFRNIDLSLIKCDGSCDSSIVGDEDFVSHELDSDNEELGLARIEEIMEAILKKKQYKIYQYHQPNPSINLSFDYSNGSGDLKDTVLGLISAEKVFRLYLDPNAGVDDRIRIDNKVDDYLKKHFDQYRDYFRYPIVDEESPEYTYYSHLKEDAQYDDLTILGILKK
ncbi:SpoIIE family protein phosphatase [Oceanispirochaeta sp.]|jgi:methyl-accepting chemotaxis protein|uniref:SpoIIE family protein phosphatase n=1 Tax=Oceanispirochaeta sp. TaxID=2035350 RepID=UPI002631D044|nr:SpoIIE family protein phosphatase [Oceanispirochaeta sp.]MDA3956995.1 SpoIIE family protein phosphatase [Oceanispirochaeta sp.]